MIPINLYALFVAALATNYCCLVAKPIAPATTTQASLERLIIVPASKYRRSPSEVAIGITTGRAEILQLTIRGKSLTLEINRRNEVIASIRLDPVPGNALEIQMVLDPVTHDQLRLPIDFLFPPAPNEYKFLIRGYFNQRYICMNSEGFVHTVMKQDGKLPEDCLWRGLILPRQLPKTDQAHQQFSFYQAFYPDVSETGSGNSTQTRWYLGFKPNAAHAARGGRLRGGARVRFHAVPYRPAFNLGDFPDEQPAVPSPSASHSAALKIGDKSVKLSNSTLVQAAIKHVNEKFAPEDCNRAKSLIQSVINHRSRRLSGVLRQLRQLRRALKRSAQQAGLSTADIAAGEKALNGYLREVTYHFLYNRGRCVREELAVTFQSAAVADLVMNLQSRRSSSRLLCRKVRQRSQVRAHKRRFRRHQRNLRKFFRDKLGVRAGFEGGRKPKVLNLFRTELNVSLPSMRTIQEARLWRRVKKQVLSALKQDMAVNELGDEMRSFYFKDKLKQLETVDAAKFILLLKQKRTAGKVLKSQPASAETEPRQSSSSRVRRRRQRRQRRQRRLRHRHAARHRSLVNRADFEQLLQKYADFPSFYFDLRCNELPIDRSGPPVR
ncbi:hypothetical protein BOX15_Mlig028597g1 [Macrostomum lignano]|uniref:Uncharacterized protein n=2 Tax=Macrostomum lignano TaxID=282301 RepID=A0A267FDE8_9PLAT|nr:hypothetical protein BOX15_Mlig028597g1 [Macrostomum lignano]